MCVCVCVYTVCVSGIHILKLYSCGEIINSDNKKWEIKLD